MVEIKIDQREYEALIRKIRGLGEAVSRRQRKAMLRKGATILRDAARANAPISDEPHFNRRGVIIQPGNLRKALQVKSLRKSPDLFVGPVTASRATASVFDVSAQSSTVDGYYAHWVEFGALNRDGTKRKGSAYMRRALASHGQKAADQVARDAQKLLDRTIKKLAKQ